MKLNPHSVANFDPNAYIYIGVFAQWPTNNGFQQMAFEAVRSRHGEDFFAPIKAWKVNPFDGNFKKKSTCDHCGAAFNYGAVFRHVDSTEYVGVGWICASEHFSCPSRATFDMERLKKTIKGVREKAKAVDKAEAWIIENPAVGDLLKVFHADGLLGRDVKCYASQTLRDMAGSLYKYGSLTTRQLEFAEKLVERRAKFLASPEEVKVSVIEGEGISISGEITSLKLKATRYGETLKMLVLDDRGFKVWGSVPKALEEPEVGKRIALTANVSKSRDDETFGFFSYPRDAELV